MPPLPISPSLHLQHPERSLAPQLQANAASALPTAAYHRFGSFNSHGCTAAVTQHNPCSHSKYLALHNFHALSVPSLAVLDMAQIFTSCPSFRQNRNHHSIAVAALLPLPPSAVIQTHPLAIFPAALLLLPAIFTPQAFLLHQNLMRLAFPAFRAPTPRHPN